MKEVNYTILKEKYPLLYSDFENYIYGGFGNLLITLEDDMFDCKFEGMSAREFMVEMKELKNKYRDEILNFLGEYGVENGGKWFYCEYFDLLEDETIDTNIGYFGVSCTDDEGDGKTNFHDGNIYIHESLEDIKGL